MKLILIYLLLPLGAGAIAAVGAGAGLLGQGINAVFNKAANRRNQRLAQEAYTRQRQDNLSDWERENAYNHPSEQMKRLKEAGLNPNLVYGNGATATGGSITSAKQDVPDTKPAEFQLGGIVQQFVQTIQMQQQTDNLREINKNLVLQQERNRLDNWLKGVNIDRAERALSMDDLKLAAMPKNIELGQAGMALKNTQIAEQTKYTIDENQRRALLTSQSLAEGIKRLLQMDLQRSKTEAETRQINAAIESIKRDTTIKDWEIELNQRGFTKSDPVWIRTANVVYDKIKNQFGFDEPPRTEAEMDSLRKYNFKPLNLHKKKKW